MIVMQGEEFLSAEEACAILGVKPATLYAYVSRGVLGSYRQGRKRKRLYRRAELDRLTRLRGPYADPDASSEAGQDGASWIPYV
jgi:excisionase family DNA binding protein